MSKEAVSRCLFIFICITHREKHIFAGMKAMALLLAGYMFLGSLFPQVDFSQLPKVIYAFQHFQQHRQEETKAGRTVSIWQFAELHFFQPSEHGHQQEHNQLPLHSLGNAFTAVPMQYPVLLQLTFVKNISRHFYTNQSLHLPGFLSDIFRPPLSEFALL